MPKNDIGGFFVSLGLNIDKNSFETGNRLIDGVGNSFNKLIGSARNAAVVLAGTAIATGTIESTSYKTAEAIGISTEALELWKATAKIAGVDANGLVSQMGKIADVMQRMKIDGSGLQDFAKKLGELGIVVDDFDLERMLNLSPDDFMKEVLNYGHTALTNGADKTTVQQIIKDILGQEGMNLFINLERRGMTIGQGLNEAGQRIYTNNETNENAQEFMDEVRLLKQASESMSKLLGSEVADQLTEYVKSINEWIDDHGDEIASGIKTVSEGVGKLVGKFVDFATSEETKKKAEEAKEIGKVLLDSAKNTGAGVVHMGQAISTGDLKGFGEAAAETANAAFGEPVKFATGKIAEKAKLADVGDMQKRVADERKAKGYRFYIDFDELSQGLQDDINNYRKEVNKTWLPGGITPLKGRSKLQDGIVRPDGTVTQVAPDDWVIAARNLGDVARAFQPEEERTEEAAEKEIVMPRTAQDINVDIPEPRIAESKNIDVADNTAINELSRFVGMLSMTFQPQQQAAVSGGEYTINQTFNISGGNDMPQVLRQQAYKGTQEGLLELMNESSRRLQLMSGTR